MSTSKRDMHDEDRYVTDSREHTPPAGERAMSNGAAAPKAPLIRVEAVNKHDLQPSYAYLAPDAATHSHGAYGSFMDGLGSCIGTIGAIPCCPCPNPYRNVRQGSVGLVSKFGRFYRAVDPGLVKINPVTESLAQIDIKIQVLPVPRQSVTTKDNVSVEIDSVLVWHITNPYRAAFAVADVRSALSERAQTTLRTVIGGRALQQVIAEREAIAAEIEQIFLPLVAQKLTQFHSIEKVAETWGVAVESILIKDIQFSNELQQSLSSAATQKRIGEAKVIAARAEVDAARLMREAADILSSPAAIQIRQLEALQSMAKTANSKVLFVPMSLQQMGTVEANQLAQGGSSNLSQQSAYNNAGLLQAIDRTN